MKTPILIERFADNGEHSHWELITREGDVVWSEEMDAQKKADILELRKAVEYLRGDELVLGSFKYDFEAQTETFTPGDFIKDLLTKTAHYEN